MTEPHPDDEALSASLDGEDPSAAAHRAGCATCATRADTLAAARGLVAGLPGAAPEGVAERAVAAALAAFATERAGIERAGTGRAGDAVVVPFPSSDRPAPAGAGSPAGSFSSHRSRPRRIPGWAMGAAAALAALLVAVPLLARDDREDQGVATAARDSAALRSSEAAAGGAQVIDGGDLGDQSDQLALGALLQGAVTGAKATASAPGEAVAPDRSTAPAAGSQAPGASPTVEVATPPATDTATSGGPTALAAPTVSSSAAFDAPDRAAATGAIAACETAVQADYGDRLGPLTYRAILRWQGTPAVLLAYRLADTSTGGPDHLGFVMALDGCRLLVVQGF